MMTSDYRKKLREELDKIWEEEQPEQGVEMPHFMHWEPYDPKKKKTSKTEK